MENVNLHKQRLITIALAALGLIFLFLPWVKLGNSSNMGYVVWGGIISGLGFAGAIVSSILVGDKTKPYDKQGKLIVIVCFALALLLTLIVGIVSNGTKEVSLGGFYTVEVKSSAGIGVWLTLVLELAALAWVSGILDKLIQQGTATSTASAPSASAPPPPPPPPPPAV